MSQLKGLMEQLFTMQIVGLALVVAGAAAVYFVARRVIVVAIRRVAVRSAVTWDDALVENDVFLRLAHLAPAMLVFYCAPLVPDLHQTLSALIQRLAIVTMVVVVALSVGALLTAANQIYSRNPESRDRPIKGYLQVVKIFLYVVAALLVVANLTDKSPWVFLSGLGAMAAVLLLVFRDTILGLVASLQLTGNDMVHVGDWIEMPQYGADGDVIDVALHTVKVQNWDKTITTIPTHKLIETSFKNWRGMSQSGGRRIKRSVSFDMGSVRFLEEDEIESFGRIALLSDYIAAKREELAAHNAEPGRDPSINADIRRLTNIGTLRAYIRSYLRNHPKIHQGMTLLVRQLNPSGEGLPIEIYAFTNDTAWAAYENIQADILDHILAIAPEFGLRPYQKPSGDDLARLAKSE
jgi:miniconductance mechanosensitive channel